MKRSKILIIATIALFLVACECKAEAYVNIEPQAYTTNYVFDNEPRLMYLYDRPARISNVVGYWTIINGVSTFYTLDKAHEAFAAIANAQKH